MRETHENEGLLNNLVTQFNSKYDCFRELVQNSIDAGSSHISVWAEYETSSGHLGVTKLCVEDYGEGMDEAIIDNQLTRLFASGKEGDLTKIGKFGIGFVSIFAMNPRVVLLQTGRAGEYWELVFHDDRTFTKSRLDYPVEGTTVTLFIPSDFRTHQEIAENTLESLRHWCRHARVEITFENRTPRKGAKEHDVFVVNRPFRELEAEATTYFEEEGTRIVCGYAQRTTYEMYNAGLTLAASPLGENLFPAQLAQRLENVSVKIESRFLEHTLSRDTVMRDEGWRRACELVETVAATQLPEQLLREIAAVLAEPTWTLQTIRRYSRLMTYLAGEPADVLANTYDVPLFRDVNGGYRTPNDVWAAYRKDGRILVTEHPSQLTARLGRMGIPVILGRHLAGGPRSNSPLEVIPQVLALMLGLRTRKTFWGTVRRMLLAADLTAEAAQRMSSPEVVYVPVDVDDAPPEHAVALLEHALRLLEKLGAGYSRVTTFVPTVAQASQPFFVTGRGFGKLMAHPPPSFGQRAHAAVNRKHPHFQRLLQQYAARPQMAAYCLAKALLLADDRMLQDDLKLIAFAQEKA